MGYNFELRLAQFRFTRHVAYLINYAIDNGFNLSLGEAFRTDYQQKEYVRIGYSKTMDSKHLKRLAIDFNIFMDGRLLFSEKSRHDEDLALCKPLGEYWVSLSEKNQWGGFFDGGWDAGHFETSV